MTQYTNGQKYEQVIPREEYATILHKDKKILKLTSHQANKESNDDMPSPSHLIGKHLKSLTVPS